MNITKEEHEQTIKPFINRIYNICKVLDTTEKVIIETKLLTILKQEFNLKELLNELISFSPLQLEVLEKYNMIDQLNELINKLKRFTST